MHDLEPFYDWQYLYQSELDELSPFYGKQHSEFEYTDTVYNYFIHPQWDNFGSTTLYVKVLFVDYEDRYCVIECIGEWNDAVYDDGQELKRNVINPLLEVGISKFIFITENVLNFHSGDYEYYEEWRDEISEDAGFIVWLNLPEQSQYDFNRSKIKQFVQIFEILDWRTGKPSLLLTKVLAKMDQYLLG